MLTVEDFKTRAKALWDSQRRMAAERRFSKSAKRAGQVRVPAAPIEFTQYEFGKWLWEKVGLNAILCPYCKAPIDIQSLTVDHIMPRSAGGKFALDNMQCICVKCNERKGKFSEAGFTALLQFSRTLLAPYDRDILLTRLRKAAAAYGSHRKKGGAPVPRPVQPNPLEFFTEPEF